MLAAFLTPVPFFEPITLWWVSFLVPWCVFRALLTQRLSWWHGCLWAGSSFLTQSAAGLYGLYQLAAGPAVMKFLFLGMILAVVSAWGGVCFWIASFCVRHVPALDPSIPLRMSDLNGRISMMFPWVLALWVFYTGVCEYYLLFNPLLPLITQPVMQFLLQSLGAPTALLCFLGMAALLAAAKRVMLGVVLFVSMWALGNAALRRDMPALPAELAHVGVVQERYPISNSCMLQVLKLREDLARANTACVMTPEACVYDSHFFSVPDLYAKWVDASKTLVVGGFRWVGENYCNSLFLIRNGRVEAVFDKRYVLPFVEYMPTCSFSCFEDMYFKTTPVRAAGENARPVWKLCDGVAIVPYICSELLLRTEPDDNYPDTMILCVCNDAWAPWPIPHMMLLTAQYQALVWQRDILYVSYKYYNFIHTCGQTQLIK